jgi:hypothetical protein
VVYSLAYLALTTLCSSLFRNPAVSLVFNFLSLFVFWLVNFIGSLGVRHEVTLSGMPGPEEAVHPIALLRYLSPSHHSNNLLHPGWMEFGGSALAFIGFTGVFLLGAWSVLRVRDV